MEQGRCGACRRKWQLTDTDLCPCGETQTMSHIVESCPLTKQNGGLSRLHSADEDAVSWLTNYGKWHAYEKKKNGFKFSNIYIPTRFRVDIFQKCFGLLFVSRAIDSYLNWQILLTSFFTLFRILRYSCKTVGFRVSIYLFHNLCFLCTLSFISYPNGWTDWCFLCPTNAFGTKHSTASQ